MERFKVLAEIAAYVAATVFFVFNVFTGTLSASLDVGMTAERRPVTKTEDDIVVEVKLKRGEHGAIKALSAEVYSRDCAAGPASLKGIDGLGVKDGRLDWNHGKGAPYLLTPNDGGVFSAILRVPQGRTCTVEVGVLGHRPLSFYDVQWRSAKVVPPTNRPGSMSRRPLE